jgi:hypothetical protein
MKLIKTNTDIYPNNTHLIPKDFSYNSKVNTHFTDRSFNYTEIVLGFKFTKNPIWEKLSFTVIFSNSCVQHIFMGNGGRDVGMNKTML